MIIQLTKEQYVQILHHAVVHLPNEACGLLGGRYDGEARTVEKVYLLSNGDQSPEHFSMNPGEQFAAIKDLRRKNIILLGNFHSHPNSPSRPSAEDIRLAFDPEMSYLILSLQDLKKPMLKSFCIREGKVTEEELQIIE